jgi:hypothetical protein
MTVGGAKYHKMFVSMKQRLESYCARHRYTLLPFMLSKDAHDYRMLIECKWAMMVDALERGCEWIVWMDADMVVVNASSTLEELLGSSEPSDSFDVVLPHQGGVPKGGVSALRDTIAARSWAWAMINTSRTQRCPDGSNYQMTDGYEQSIMQCVSAYERRRAQHAAKVLPISMVPCNAASGQLVDAMGRNVSNTRVGTMHVISGGGPAACSGSFAASSATADCYGGGVFYGSSNLFFAVWGFNSYKLQMLRMVHTCERWSPSGCEACGLDKFLKQLVWWAAR